MGLRPSEQHIAQLTAAYARHRPLIQRGLTAAFVLYVLSTTYNGLFARAGAATRNTKGKGKAKGDGKDAESKKPPRVAVRRCIIVASLMSS